MREHQKRLLVTVSGIEPLSPPSKGVSLPLIYTEITGTRVWNRTRTFRLSGEYTDDYITRAIQIWQGRRESNSRTKGQSLVCLPLHHTPTENLVLRVGFAPTI